ncbi:hypothetical protein Tco_1155493 [Tanacetum coccineum]
MKDIKTFSYPLDEERVTTDPKTTKDVDWNDPSVQKYWDMKNKPKSEAQARKNMIVYLKNQIHILLMQNGIAIHMLTEKKYPLSQEMISKMLSKRLEVDQESTQAYELLKFIRSQLKK